LIFRAKDTIIGIFRTVHNYWCECAPWYVFVRRVQLGGIAYMSFCFAGDA
jgi:hypothetical protein